MADDIEVEVEDEVLDLVFTLRTIAEVMETGLVNVQVYPSLLADAADVLEEVYAELNNYKTVVTPTYQDVSEQA